MTATMLLCWRFNIEIETISQYLIMVGFSCVVESADTYYIAHISVIEGVSIDHLIGISHTGVGRYYGNNSNNKSTTPLFG